MNRKILAFVILILFILSNFGVAQEKAKPWPRRVLITNDDGIDNVRIKELARAFSKIAETYVVAPLKDRSGSGNYSPMSDVLRLESQMIGEGIHAYGVDGFPADCIMVALFGLMRDKPPDLVISGINKGPNLRDGWFASGTIGGARLAALSGLPAIAVSSGLKSKTPGALDAATNWVVRLAQSDLVRHLKPLQYITVDIPGIPPTKIKGVRVAERQAPLNLKERMKIVEFKKLETVENQKSLDNSFELWRMDFKEQKGKEYYDGGLDSDISLYKSGYVVVVPMIANEHDYKSLILLKIKSEMLPKWTWPIQNGD